MATTRFRERKTPGVYVTELDAFPPSVVGVETAVPAFIGYTEESAQNGKSVNLRPVRITSLADYEEVFGGAPPTRFDITPTGDATNFDVDIGGGKKRYYLIDLADDSKEFLLYDSVRLFYANGGGNCYVVSVGTYAGDIDYKSLQAGVDAVGDHPGPTMLVVPEAIKLPESNYSALVQAMLKQCATEKDRMAILDVLGAETITSENVSSALIPLIESFQGAVGSEHLNYGAAYFPFLNTSIVRASEVNFTNFDAAELKAALDSYADVKYADDETQLNYVKEELIAKISPDRSGEEIAPLNDDLLNALKPVLGQIYSVTAQEMGVLPPSGAMAGLYALNDQTRGVQNAPANYALAAVTSPTVNLDNKLQGDLNVPLNGKAVDVIRYFVGRGTVVWGARTLDGNSNDWRYIQVRRTIIYIEQSIKLALDPFVFAANDGKTWVTVVSMISNFLQGFWSQGGLMGATADEAFSVECGLGSTMTAQDILEGYMVVQVTLQMIRPAEFIELTFRQRMEG